MTTNAIQLPTNPAEFEAFMNNVWEAYDTEPEAGGMYIGLSAAFVELGDARDVAKLCGLRRTGSSVRGGNPGYIYRFPDSAGVFITDEGDGVSAKVSKYGPRSKVRANA